MNWKHIENQGKTLINDEAKPLTQRMQDLCAHLEKSVAHYDWVGFYLRDGETRELVLGPYVGEKTDHTRIGFGEGICGQAAETEKTFVVQDVEKESNYLSCNIHVKSEIVVPIMYKGTMLGEIDIDSHTATPFTAEDSKLLEALAEEIAPMLFV